VTYRQVLSLNPVHTKVYSIQHYVVKFVSDLQQGRAHQTRRSGWLFRLGFNEIAQFLSKNQVLVALVSLFKSVFFSPIIILFLQYSHKRSSHTGFDVQYFIPNSLIASFLRSLCSTFVLWKVGGHAVVGKETLIFW
jgi:hypothetical protein